MKLDMLSPPTTRVALAKMMKRDLGINYNIKGVNLFVRRLTLTTTELKRYLNAKIPLGYKLRMSTVNPHFRASYFSTPFWLALYVEYDYNTVGCCCPKGSCRDTHRARAPVKSLQEFYSRYSQSARGPEI
jgi:hypothetical protein